MRLRHEELPVEYDCGEGTASMLAGVRQVCLVTGHGVAQSIRIAVVSRLDIARMGRIESACLASADHVVVGLSLAENEPYSPG